MKSEGEARKKLLTVRAHPGSRTAKVEKLSEGEYKVHVLAPPEKGEANREVVAALADYFGLPARSVRIVRGERSRIKLVVLETGG
jgi:uncharacterized protein (TIGR00251 family)